MDIPCNGGRCGIGLFISRYFQCNELPFCWYLGLIPKLDTDTLLFMIAAHPNLRTTNGLNPKSSINELLQQYPVLMVMQDLMNEWEFFQDEKNGWDFIFMTDRTTEVGEYIKDDMPAKPKRLNTKTDWITIREVRSE